MNFDPISISVVIPCFNAEPFLAESIQSVQSQGLPEMEIIVVDDGSTDHSLEIARSFASVRCLSQPNSGPAVARNLGIGLAKGSFLAFNDADDVWPEGHLASLLRPFSEDPGLELALGRMQYVGERVWKKDGSPDFQGPPFQTFGFGCSLIRREVFERVGYLNPNFRRGEDTEWFTRTRESGIRAYLTEDVVLYYRRHDRNMTRDTKPVGPLMLQILKASLDRRRARSQDGGAPLEPVKSSRISRRGEPSP